VVIVFEVMKGIPDKSIDLVLTDPPYKIVVNRMGDGTGFYKKTNHLAKIDESFGSDFEPLDFLNIVINKSKNGLLVWSSQSLLLDYINFAINNKLKWDLMFWHKINCCPNHYNHLMVDTEYCIRIYPRGAYFNNNLKYIDYHKYFIEPVQHIKGHPTPKPMNIIKKQIELFSKKEDIILDLFLGSGTLAVACKELGRRYIGIEISPEYCEIARNRVKAISESLF
jgi:site-specific DNA-methyltransferase (adenine-specific)